MVRNRRIWALFVLFRAPIIRMGTKGVDSGSFIEH